MSKLNDVKAALDTNPDVIVVNLCQKPNQLFRSADSWSDWVDIFVVPRKGLYTAKVLQDFMMHLVPIVPTQMDDFYQSGNGMSFGKLYYDEVIGTEVTAGTRTTIVTDPDVALPEGYADSEVVDLGRTRNLKRRTLLWVFPDESYALRAVDGKDVYGAVV